MKDRDLTNPEFLTYLLSLDQEKAEKMKGTIRPISREANCPVCEKKYKHIERVGYGCAKCKTVPRKFYIDLHWNGKRARICSDKSGLALDSYSRALDLMGKIQTEIRDHTFDPTKYVAGDLKKYWVSTLIQEFLEEKEGSIAPSYWKDYKRYADAAISRFKTKDVREIRKHDLNKYKKFVMSEYEPKGKTAKKVRSWKTVKNYLEWFGVFLNYCKNDLDIIDRVPGFPDVDEEEPEWRWLDTETQIAILETIPESDRDIIKFLMLHGCRPAEARALTVKRVDLRTMSIEIRDTFSGKVLRPRRKGKKSKPYVLPIHPEMDEYFIQRVNGNHPEAFVFTNPRNGLPYSGSALNRLWNNVRTKMNLSKDLRLYDSTRHSVGSLLSAQGESDDKIRDILGHSSAKMTERYIHHDKLAEKRATLAKLSLKGKKAKIIDIKRPKEASG